jgi:hypothetical protein
MPTSIIIVDDFLEEPAALRAQALRLTYPEQQGAFPGRNSLERMVIPGLDEEVSRLVAEPVRAITTGLSHGKCRVTRAEDKGRARVHTDPSHWSGILYLSRPEDCRGGTQFFRHIRTQSDQAPVTPAELAALGYASQDEAHRDIIESDSLDESAWELTLEVPMRFNRLLLLRPWLWHTAGPAFGDRMDNARLVYLMFFQTQR